MYQPLKLYRRHKPDCRLGLKGTQYKNTKCDCPVWVFGYRTQRANEPQIRQSLGTSNWDDAHKEMERRFFSDVTLPPLPPPPPKHPKPEDKGTTIERALEKYVEVRETNNKSRGTLKVLRSFSKIFLKFCEMKDDKKDNVLECVSELSLDHLEYFMAWRKATAAKSFRTLNSDLGNLRGFCAYCVKHKWMTENYGKELDWVEPENGPDEKPRPMPNPPYSEEEIAVILNACSRIAALSTARDYQWGAARARAIILLFLDTGLRVSDAVRFRKEDIRPDRMVKVYQTKTGDPVYSRLREATVEALNAIGQHPKYPNQISSYFFWNEVCGLDGLKARLRKSFGRIGKQIGIRVNAHRFRNTFGMMMLDRGVKMRIVSKLLGHKSVRTTEKYYEHWSKRTQENMLDALEVIPDFGRLTPAKIVEFPKAVGA